MPNQTETIKPGARTRIAHETREFVGVFLFVAPFFLSFEAYRMYLLRDLREPYVALGLALFSALVLSKVILIGEFIHLGSHFRRGPLLLVSLWDAAVFTVFYAMFHLLDVGIHAVIHRESFAAAVRTEAFTHVGRMAMRMVVVFFAFIPFFALRESRHVIGEENFDRLFFGSRRH